MDNNDIGTWMGRDISENMTKKELLKIIKWCGEYIVELQKRNEEYINHLSLK